MTRGRWRSWACAPAAALRPCGPRHASTTRGRCCGKLAGVPRPSAAGSPPRVGWRGNRPQSQARKARAAQPESVGGARGAGPG